MAEKDAGKAVVFLKKFNAGIHARKVIPIIADKKNCKENELN